MSVADVEWWVEVVVVVVIVVMPHASRILHSCASGFCKASIHRCCSRLLLVTVLLRVCDRATTIYQRTVSISTTSPTPKDEQKNVPSWSPGCCSNTANCASNARILSFSEPFRLDDCCLRELLLPDALWPVAAGLVPKLLRPPPPRFFLGGFPFG